MRRLLAIAAVAVLALVLLPTGPATADDYPENWFNCKTTTDAFTGRSQVSCDARVIVKAPDKWAARHMCTKAIYDQGRALGLPVLTGGPYDMKFQTRPKHRYWCEVWMHFTPPKAPAS